MLCIPALHYKKNDKILHNEKSYTKCRIKASYQGLLSNSPKHFSECNYKVGITLIEFSGISGINDLKQVIQPFTTFYASYKRCSSLCYGYNLQYVLTTLQTQASPDRSALPLSIILQSPIYNVQV